MKDEEMERRTRKVGHGTLAIGPKFGLESDCQCMICKPLDMRKCFQFIFEKGDSDPNDPSRVPLQGYCTAFEDIKYARSHLDEFPGLSNEAFFKEACECIDWHRAQGIPEDSSPAYASWWDRGTWHENINHIPIQCIISFILINLIVKLYY
jgi:hypothetical protein